MNVKACLKCPTIPTNMLVEMLVYKFMPLRSSNKITLCSSQVSNNLRKLILALIFLKFLRIFLLDIYFIFYLREGVAGTSLSENMGLRIPFFAHVVILYTFAYSCSDSKSNGNFDFLLNSYSNSTSSPLSS